MSERTPTIDEVYSALHWFSNLAREHAPEDTDIPDEHAHVITHMMDKYMFCPCCERKETVIPFPGRKNASTPQEQSDV